MPIAEILIFRGPFVSMPGHFEPAGTPKIGRNNIVRTAVLTLLLRAFARL